MKRIARPTTEKDAERLRELYVRCEGIADKLAEERQHGGIRRGEARSFEKTNFKVDDVLPTNPTEARAKKASDRDRARTCLNVALPEHVREGLAERAVERAISARVAGKTLPKKVSDCLVPRDGETAQHRVRDAQDRLNRFQTRDARGTKQASTNRTRSTPAHGRALEDVRSVVTWGLTSGFYWLHRHERPRDGTWRAFERAVPSVVESRDSPDGRADDPVPHAFHVPPGGDVDWETARYCLETFFGMQQVPKDCNQDLSGLAAHRVRKEDWTLCETPLGEDERIADGDCVVLFRRPTGARSADNPHVPLRFTPDWIAHERRQFATEEEELSALVDLMSRGESNAFRSSGAATFPKRPAIVRDAVPSPYDLRPEEGPRWIPLPVSRSDSEAETWSESVPVSFGAVKPDYVCRRCAAQGEHYEDKCPARADTLFVPMWAKRRPCGVSMGSLVPVRDPKDVGRARYYGNGRFYLSLDTPKEKPPNAVSTGGRPKRSRSSPTAHKNVRWEGGSKQSRTQS